MLTRTPWLDDCQRIYTQGCCPAGQRTTWQKQGYYIGTLKYNSYSKERKLVGTDPGSTVGCRRCRGGSRRPWPLGTVENLGSNCCHSCNSRVWKFTISCDVTREGTASPNKDFQVATAICWPSLFYYVSPLSFFLQYIGKWIFQMWVRFGTFTKGDDFISSTFNPAIWPQRRTWGQRNHIQPRTSNEWAAEVKWSVQG